MKFGFIGCYTRDCGLLKKNMEAKLFTEAVIQQELNKVTAVYRKNPNVAQVVVKHSKDAAQIARKF